MGCVDRVRREDRGGGDVVGVRVGVDHVGHRLVGNLGDGLQIFVPDGRRRVHGYHTFAGGEEHSLISAFGHPV
jgi:hypothetical protein